MKLVLKPRSYSDHYEQLDGDSPFVRSVNKLISNYWVSTGNAMPVQQAVMEVLADLYNQVSNSSNKE